MTDDINDQVAQNLTDERLASDIERVAANVRFLPPDERAARLREGARRLVRRTRRRPEPKPLQQLIITFDDGHQVAYMHGNVFARSNIGYSWPTPLPEATRPHQPGTWYRGEW
jgi:hypothetical protein